MDKKFTVDEKGNVIDEYNNLWTAEYVKKWLNGNKKQQKALGQTRTVQQLVNSLKDCKNCLDCYKCTRLVDSYLCSNCIDCENCRYCHMCLSCTNVDGGHIDGVRVGEKRTFFQCPTKHRESVLKEQQSNKVTKDGKKNDKR